MAQIKWYDAAVSLIFCLFLFLLKYNKKIYRNFRLTGILGESKTTKQLSILVDLYKHRGTANHKPVINAITLRHFPQRFLIMHNTI